MNGIGAVMAPVSTARCMAAPAMPCHAAGAVAAGGSCVFFLSKRGGLSKENGDL